MYVPCILYIVLISTNSAQYIYIYIYLFIYFNNAYIIITPTCSYTDHPSTHATSAQVYPNDIRSCKHTTHTNYIVKIM